MIPRPLRRPILAAAALAAAILLSPAARADDGLIPPGPEAAKVISCDGKSFLIRGQRVYITSGAIHYARVPRELWRDRLLQLKNAGFNTVETYIFWNFHEPKEGEFDLTTAEHDFAAFFKLAQELGLYVIVRPGPHICAEWDSGGLPVWLRFKGDLKVRTEDPRWLAAVDKWFDKCLPIIAQHQIHKGGPIILMQLENEFNPSFGTSGWGQDAGGNKYLLHLEEKTRQSGIEVPRFYSGFHHGHDPASGSHPFRPNERGEPWDTSKRANPWLSTEFWPGWFNEAGELDEGRLRMYTRSVSKMMAYGGGGYNAYMLHGGTNFAWWPSPENASSYDYRAAIGQSGGLRTIYYNFRRANLFAQTFAETLCSADTTKDFASAAPGIRILGRKGPAGAILFLDNDNGNPIETKIDDVPLKVAPYEIRPIVKDAPLAPGLKLDLAAARVLGKTRHGDLTTLVIYGPPGEDAVLKLSSTEAGAQAKALTPAFTIDGSKATLKLKFPESGPDLHAATFGKATLRILAVSSAMADRTWFVTAGNKPFVVCGPNYVSEAAEKDGKLIVTAVRKRNTNITSALAWGPEDQPRKLALPPSPLPPEPPVPALTNWQIRPAISDATTAYDETKWFASEHIKPMGADGHPGSLAWYRTAIDLPAAGSCQLDWNSLDAWMAVYVNGEFKGAVDKEAKRMELALPAGKSTLALLTSHHGREDLWGHTGRIDLAHIKGLTGPVNLTPPAKETVPIAGWRWKPGKNDGETIREMTAANLDVKAPGWADADLKADVFNKAVGTAWFIATLPDVKGSRKLVRFTSVDDNATVYLNGRKLGEHKGWNEGFTLSADWAWKNAGPNILAVMVDNLENTGGIMGPVELLGGERTPLNNWRMRGGPDNPDTPGLPWQPCAKAPDAPAFYRATFTAPPPAASGPHPIWRVDAGNLAQGFVWLNGHNLGRFPEKAPIEGVYLPECWIKPGENTLILFDEAGRDPRKVKLISEQDAYRDDLILQETK